METKKIKARGLRALIPLNPKTKSKKKKDNIYYVEIKKIRQTPGQIQKEVDKKILDELTESVRRYGVVQPIILAKVEKRKKGGLNVYYRLVSGQKRLLAAKAAGLRVVPAVIIMKDDKI